MNEMGNVPLSKQDLQYFNMCVCGGNSDKCNKRNIGGFFKQSLCKILSLGQKIYLDAEIMHWASACQHYIKASVHFSFPQALFSSYCPQYQAPFITYIYSWRFFIIYKNEEAATKWLLVSSETCKIDVKSKWFKTAILLKMYYCHL